MKTALLTFLLVGIIQAASAKDEVADSVLADGSKVTVSVKTDGRTEKKTFDFPKAITDYKVIPFMPGASVIIAAKPREAGDWFWGIAYLGDGAPEKGTVVRWTKSPPHDATLLAVEHPEGDSFVVYAASFKRDFPNANEIRTYAYVNHCPAAFGARDPVGCLYSGEIGGPLKFEQAEQAGADQSATAPESKPEGNEKPQPESKVAPR
ncbi:MAG: hypothetical protein V4819_25450 [Verrucomicrobiota bacterium]